MIIYTITQCSTRVKTVLSKVLCYFLQKIVFFELHSHHAELRIILSVSIAAGPLFWKVKHGPHNHELNT